MEIWSLWNELLRAGIDTLGAHFGVSQAVAIILFTLLGRLLLMPISLKAAYTMQRNQLALKCIKPQIERLKEEFSNEPAILAQKTMALYKEHKIKFLDRTSVANITSQGIFGLGLFQALQAMTIQGKFLWIANLAKPDAALAFLAGALTFFAMILMPSATEHSTLVLFIVPAIVSMFVIASFPSVIGLYWATSSFVTCVQSLIIRLADHGPMRNDQ